MPRTPSPVLSALLLSGMLAACTPMQGSSSKGTEAYQAAQNLKNSGNTQAAAESWRKLVLANPDDIDAAIELSSAERKLGNALEATKLMADYNSRFPDNINLITQLGYALIDAEKTEDAVATFDHAITLQPQNPLLLSGKGVAFDKAGNHLAAQDIYKDALALSPDSVTVRNNLAMSLILNDEPQKAIELLEKLYTENASNQTIRQNLALAYGIKGDNKKALELNLKDLPAEEAEENLRFYQKYIQQHKASGKNKARTHVGIGFSETSPDIKAKTIDEDATPPATAQKPKASKVKVIPLKFEETPEVKKEPVKAIEKIPSPTPIILSETPPKPTEASPEVPATPHGTVLPTRSTTDKADYPGQPR